MTVTFHDDESSITFDPTVPGPKTVLYDHLERPLKRPIGFIRPVDNRPTPRIHSPNATK